MLFYHILMYESWHRFSVLTAKNIGNFIALFSCWSNLIKLMYILQNRKRGNFWNSITSCSCLEFFLLLTLSHTSVHTTISTQSNVHKIDLMHNTFFSTRLCLSIHCSGGFGGDQCCPLCFNGWKGMFCVTVAHLFVRKIYWVCMVAM